MSRHQFLQFTPGEAAALLHRLDAATLPEVFADTDGCEHLLPGLEARSEEIAAQLRHDRRVLVDTWSEQDREILRECIEGSTWAACEEDGSLARRMAVRSLRGAAAKIETRFGLPADDISIPEC